MPYQKHPRKVTEEQFATETTIDGSRIDSALHDLIEYHNNIPSSGISTRYVPQTYFAGWLPPTATLGGQAPHFPWQEALNASQTVSASPPPMANPQRVKGYHIPGWQTIEEEPSLYTSQLVWTSCFQFSKPAILTKLFVHLGRDNSADPSVTIPEYTLDPIYGAVPPTSGNGSGPTYAPGSDAPLSAGDPTLDFVVVADVSSPFSPEDRARNDVEVTRNQFTFSRDLFRDVPWPNVGSFADMAPAGWPGGAPFGWVIPLEVHVPLHQNSRLRVHLVIPGGGAGIGAGAPYNSPWEGSPWMMCQWGLTMVVLEEITE